MTRNVPELQKPLLASTQMKLYWDILAKEPLFGDRDKELTLDKSRELSFWRLKCLAEYDFFELDEMMMACPFKMLAL